MSDDAKNVHDPRVLRAIAHPVRNRILEELGAGGPQRAADMATVLGIPANQASFHLRQLAKYGLVVEAPEAARDGRDRVWRAVHESGLTININELAAVPGGKAAATVYRNEAAAAAHAPSTVRSPRNVSRTPPWSCPTPRCVSPETRPGPSQPSWRPWRRLAATRTGARARGHTYQLLQILQPALEA